MRPRDAAAPADLDYQPTMCPYCGVGCGLLVQVRDGRVTKVKGDPDHPASLGDLCAKAVHLPPVLRAPDRLLYPSLRYRRDAPLDECPGSSRSGSRPTACANREDPRPGRRGVFASASS
jgi:anaerobic selenocysteine-containing dehydrogenase